MRRRSDATLNLSLSSSGTDKIFPELISGGVTAKHSLMKFGSIVSTIIVFRDYRAIVTSARF